MTTYTKQDIEERAQRLLDVEVLGCQSSLVDMLLQRGDVDGFTIDDINYNLPDPSDWDIDECRTFIDENEGADYGPQACDYTTEGEDGETVTDEDEYLEALQEHINDMEPREIYEWWLVSSWLASALADAHEPIIDNDYGYWWGRTCTGQSIMLDGTLQNIAEYLLSK